MKNKPLSLLLAGSIMLLWAIGCKDDSPSPSDKPLNENELITTAKLLLTDSAGGQLSVFEFSDPDGEGGNNPLRFDSIVLTANRTYYCSLLLLDESKSPADTVSDEIRSEADNHLFGFENTGTDLRIQITDKDSKNLPLGLESTWKTGGPGQGTLRLRLKHQPGVKDGNISPGETDLDLLFPLLVR